MAKKISMLKKYSGLFFVWEKWILENRDYIEK